MRNPEFKDAYYTNVEQFEEENSDVAWPSVNADGEYFECDFCSACVNYKTEPRVGHYLSDRLVHAESETEQYINNRGKLWPLAVYCEDCANRRLFYPAKGYTEVRGMFTLDEDTMKREYEITDVSNRDEGIPWDPEELMSKISKGQTTELKEYFKMIHGFELRMGPEDVVRSIFANGDIDIREIVKWDGSIDDKALGRARRKYANKIDNIHNSRKSRIAYRDHIRENWHN